MNMGDGTGDTRRAPVSDTNPTPSRPDDLLYTVFESSPHGVVMVDSAGAIVLVNRESERIFGYSRNELIGRPLELLVPHRVRSRHRAARHEFSRHPSPRGVAGRQLVGIRRDGTEVPLEIGLNPVQTDGKAYVLATVVDVSGQREAEDALRRSDARYRRLVHGSIQGILIHVDGIVKLANPALARVFGYESADEFVETPIWPFVAPEDRAAIAAYMQARLRGEPAPSLYEFRGVKRDGTLVWLESAVSIIEWDGAPAFLVTIVDVSDRKRALEALAESEARYRKLTETAYEAIALTVDGVIREANRGFAEMFGYSVEEVIGRTVTDFVADQSVQDVRDRVIHRIEGRYEMTGKRKDGNEIQLEATTRNHPIGGRLGRITAMRDVSERRALEAQLRQAQKMEAVGRLAGGVAHDFNNLLTVIAGSSDLLLQDLEANDPRRQEAEEIRRAADRAASLTRQLLAFSRHQLLNPRVLALNEVVAGVEKLVRRLIGEDVELTVRLAPDAGSVRADAGQLEQVIMNLAVNARDAMPQGGRLTLETANVELDEQYSAHHVPVVAGAYVMLAVADTGIGMDEETKSRIFEPFFTTKPVGRGTGLGLATVYGIVKQSDGFVWVYSEPSLGTTFKIYLPRVDEAPDALSAAPEPRTLRGVETILLVEDAEALREVARKTLERYGYTVLEAEDAAAALALVGKHPDAIDLVLTDVVMPGLSGPELADRLTAGRPKLRVLFMSGYTDSEALRRRMVGRNAPYIQKPFTPVELAQKVRQVLEG
jgi:PAS domain S-box-containing protein